MQFKRIRPQFIIETRVPIATILEVLKNQLNSPDTQFTGTIANNYAIINIPESESHFWSPRLTLDFSEKDNITRIVGLFGPRPVVWMLFMGFYIAAIFLMFVGLMWGGAQWSLGMSPTGFWFTAIGAVIFLIAYSAALIGQKLSEEQMQALQMFVETVVKPHIIKQTSSDLSTARVSSSP